MIILLTGPTGSGKTDTSWALIEAAAPMVFLDCDWFAARIPFSWNVDSDVESVYQAISLMMQFHIDRGSDRFVIPLTLEKAFSYARHRDYLERFDRPVYLFRLNCSADTLRQRIIARDRNLVQKSGELAAVQDHLRLSEGLPEVFVPVDVSVMNEREVAQRILEFIHAAGR